MTDVKYSLPKPQIIEGNTEDWELVIGMEVHAQIKSKAKLFSSASTNFGSEPNSNVSLVDAAMPGMLPVLNMFCIEQAVKTGLGLKAEINLFSQFDRKNYFYPDLPQGYQISQLYHPLVGEGEITINIKDKVRKIGIERIHVEQDAGKSIHDMDPNLSFIDLNRTGVGLMEIVSRPDIRSSEEATTYLKKLRQILQYLDTCDGNMQEGSLRADVNVSILRKGTYEKYLDTKDLSCLGTRCEIKNMNSIRFIQQAIDYEARRQVGILEDGGEIVQETRLYDPDTGKTRSMRSKEEAHDYRYFPCPDLPPLILDQSLVDRIKANLPELPDEKKNRFISYFGINEYDANVLTSDKNTADFFEQVSTKNTGKLAANWIINELFGRLNKEGISINKSPVSSNNLKEILSFLEKEEISSKIAKELFEQVWIKQKSPSILIDELGLKQLTDKDFIEKLVEKIIDENPQQVEKVKENPKVLGWFVGQVMKESKGKANPKLTNQLVAHKLNLKM
tara:strand:+ start:340 stop:1854 length:1515 start_codon:yes stop_codon:yes gene_type:complete